MNGNKGKKRKTKTKGRNKGQNERTKRNGKKEGQKIKGIKGKTRGIS